MKVNILGQDYEILHQTKEENSSLRNANGICECYSKEIIIEIMEKEEGTWANFSEYKNLVLRHELIHAYFNEMGLHDKYGKDEVLVDCLAHQIPKMAKTFKEVGVE